MLFDCRGDDIVEHPKQRRAGDPVERLALQRKDIGEHGGLNLSIEASTAFTVLSATTMPKIFHPLLINYPILRGAKLTTAAYTSDH